MAERPLRFIADTKVPTKWKPDYFYAIYLGGNDVECYVTSQSGVPKRVGNTQMIIDIINERGVDWGNIGGDISDQTDLVTLLNLKEDKTNKVQDVSIINHTLYPSVQTMVDYINSLIPNGLISGGIVTWSGSGYVYDVSEATVKINGTVYNIPSGQVTLQGSHPSLDRIDVVYVDINGFDVLTGIPAEEPVTPQVNVGEQVYLTSIIVSANTVEPGGEVVTEWVYRENQEWVGSFTGIGTVDFESTTDPESGVYSVESTDVEKDNLIIFDKGSPFEPDDWDTLSLKINLKQPVEKDLYLVVGYLDITDNPVSNQVQLPINRDLTGSYQFTAVQKELFTITGTAQKIYIKHTRPTFGTYPIGYFLDDIRLQSGVSQGNNLQHNSLNGLNVGDYQHLTQDEKEQALNPEADNVSVTPFGDIVSTDVQSAIEELQDNITESMHDPVTVTDSTDIDFTLTGQDITAEIKNGSVGRVKLTTEINASLDLADSAIQEVYNPYGTITLMLLDQANQTDQQIVKVTDASADTNLTFPTGETRKYAYYQYLGTTNGDMTDYRLVSAPYGNIGSLPDNLDISEKKWVIFGDSVSYTTSTIKYTGKVAEILGFTGTVSNAVPGDNILNQSEDLDALILGDSSYFLGFDICSIFLGYNDVRYSIELGKRNATVNSESYAGKLKHFIEVLKTSNPKLEIYIITPPEINQSGGGAFTYRDKNGNGWGMVDLRDLIMQICLDYSVQCIDLYSLSGFNLQTIATYTTDGLHPNEDGHTLFADIISKAFLIRNSKTTFNDSSLLSSTYGEPSGSDKIKNVVSCTTTEYASGTKIETTLYIITDA
jgi:lysophospholipase L1-like esterase